MDNRNELKPEEMEQVTGGVWRTIDTGIPGKNAAIRSGASVNAGQIASLPSGTQVDTVTDKVVYDDASGRNFVEIRFTDKYGKPGTGWVAASIVGLPR